MSIWTTKRTIIGLLLFGTFAACVFAQVWGFMTAISLPTFLEPVRVEHPHVIVWWIYVLYLGSVILTLVPAAAFWLVVGADRRTVSALLAVVPLLVLLVADFAYAALTFDFPLRIHRLLWDGAIMVIGATALFLTFDVLRRLTTRSSRP